MELTLPSILVEGGFVSNAEERDRMKSGWFRESIAQGLAAAPDAFIGLLAGRNFGKQLVKLV